MAGGLDYMIFKGPFQPKPCWVYESVILWSASRRAGSGVDLISDYSCLLGGCREDESWLFSEMFSGGRMSCTRPMLADGEIPVRWMEKTVTTRVLRHGTGAQRGCRVSVLERIQTWLNKVLSNLTRLGLLWVGAWTRDLQGSLPISVLLRFSGCQPSCLTQTGVAHNLVEGVLCPTTTQALTSENHQHGWPAHH